MDTAERKQKQLKIILATNPAPDEYHTWVRSVEDILTLEETMDDPDFDCEEFDPDWTRLDAERAIQNGEIRIYSSNPIRLGVFVTPSKMEAKSYSKNGEVYSDILRIEDIAWLDPTQGQVAIIRGIS